MGGSPQIQALLKQGLLPFLMGKMGIKMPGAGGGQAPPSAPQAGPTVPGKQGSLGAQGQAPQGGPQINTPPPVGGSIPAPAAQKPPHEEIRDLQGLLMSWNKRKDQKESAEAANIAQNLMTAMQNNDVAMVHEILNDKNSTKILNKVYKGWLTQSKEAQKPGKEPDATMQGFEEGLQKYMQGKGPQPAMPKTMGGYMLPQASPGQQLAGMKENAELQAAQQDPARLLSSQLTSGEKREVELGAGPQKIQAEIEKASLAVDKAQAERDKASFELKKSESEYLRAGKKADADLAELNVKHQIALANLDTARWRATAAKARAAGVKTLSFVNKQRINAADQAEEILSKIVKENRGFNADDIKQLDTILRAAGATELAKDLPSSWTRWARGVGSVKDTLDALKLYRDSLHSAAGDLEDKTEEADDTEGDEEGDTPSEEKAGEPMEGDIVKSDQGTPYRFKGGDPSNKANYEKVTPKKP